MVVTVLGPKRGGTSVLSGLLHAHGVSMGERFDQADASNPDGYFEDRAFADLVRPLMSSATVQNGYLTQYDPVAYERVRAYIQRRNEQCPNWGLKNFILPFVFPQFAEMCRPSEVFLLRIHRRFSATIRSWIKHARVDFETAVREQGILLFNIDETYNAYQGPKMTVVFENLIQDPEETVSRIAEWLDIPFRSEALANVSPAHCHFG